ncbi:hypothetical protein Lalb_Chr07g0188791 [Lupinus albus]|uniref:Uncharacterized protein n=1 Tax=Lupinus albus TaxID=3870 RepID=A0A6A4QBF0_LUPAL|nr:hypothetical protein Lalb_Chr07g0188791 [Lupinus albus]
MNGGLALWFLQQMGGRCKDVLILELRGFYFEVLISILFVT